MSEVVRLQGVAKSYTLGQTRVDALKGVDVVLNAGEFTALIGASGSGKSTLLNVIGTIDSADRGTVMIDGQNIGDMSEDQRSELRNRKIGFVFQSFNLVPVLNVFENIELPLLIRDDLGEEQKKASVRRVIKDVGLEEFAHHLPDQLSGGQRQRVAIARALVTDPILILADEPTANLDSKTTHTIIDLMLDLNQRKKVTFLFCSHDEKLVNRVSRVLKIQDGLVVS